MLCTSTAMLNKWWRKQECVIFLAETVAHRCEGVSPNENAAGSCYAHAVLVLYLSPASAEFVLYFGNENTRAVYLREYPRFFIQNRFLILVPAPKLWSAQDLNKFTHGKAVIFLSGWCPPTFRLATRRANWPGQKCLFSQNPRQKYRSAVRCRAVILWYRICARQVKCIPKIH